MIGYLCINFRSNEQQDRIVKLVDQYTDEDKIRMGMHMAQKEGLELVKKSAKKEYLKMFEFQQLKLCKNVSSLEPFAIPTWEQMMDGDQSVISFLLNNQNQSMTMDNPILFDFKAPLEMEIRLMRDAQM